MYGLATVGLPGGPVEAWVQMNRFSRRHSLHSVSLAADDYHDCWW